MFEPHQQVMVRDRHPGRVTSGTVQDDRVYVLLNQGTQASFPVADVRPLTPAEVTL